MRRFLTAAALGLAAIAASGRAEAVPITYAETFTATGTLDGTSFLDATVVLTGVGDTDNIVDLGGGILINHLPTSVTIGAITDTFTDSIEVFVNLGLSAFGFSDETLGEDLANTSNAAYTTYDLAGPLGPTTGDLIFLNIATTYGMAGGSLTFDRGTGPVTVTATTSAVPEPSSLTLAGIGGLALLGVSRRHRKSVGK